MLERMTYPHFFVVDMEKAVIEGLCFILQKFIGQQVICVGVCGRHYKDRVAHRGILRNFSLPLRCSERRGFIVDVEEEDRDGGAA